MGQSDLGIAAEVLEDRTLLTTLSVSPVAMAEGANGLTTFTFDVRLDQPIGRDVTFNFATVPDAAQANSDFTPVNGSGRILAGQIATTIEVPVIGNNLVELDEQFFVELSNLQAGGLPIEFDPAAQIRPGDGIKESGAFDTPDLAWDVQVVGNRAYVADSSSGLRVLDVSNPTNITELGVLDTPGAALGVQMVGNLAYVADGLSGLRVLDVSNPANIMERGFFDTPSSAAGVQVVGNRAYIADTFSGLRVLDVSNPASITELGAFDTPNSAEGLHVVGNLAYVADGFSGLRVLDVSNPASITELGAFDTPGAASEVQVVGNLAYVADAVGGLRVLDVSNPANITEVGVWSTPNLDPADGVHVVGNLAYVADRTNGLRVLDVSNPASITELGVLDTPGAALGVQVVGNLAFVVARQSGLRVLDVSNPASFTELGAFDTPTPGSTEAVQVVGNLPYIADVRSGLRVLDVSNPASITELGAFDTPNFALDVQVVGNRAFVADGSSGLRVLNVSNPASITELGAFDTPDFANAVQVVGNFAYVADGRSGLRVLNVSNPASITELGTFDTPGLVLAVQVVGTRAYVVDGMLRVLDVSNPANIIELGAFGTPISADSLHVVSNLAYVTDGSNLRVLDVSNPVSITELGAFDTSDFALDLQVVGNLAYIANNLKGLRVLDVSDPANITEVGALDTPDSAHGVHVVGNLAYVADNLSGLRVLGLGLSARVAATIQNDDSTSLNISNVTRTEGNNGPTKFTFNVTLDQAISQDVTFNFSTVSDTALAGSDFAAMNSSGRIRAGETSTTIDVFVTGESILESNERFFVDLSNVQAGGLSVLLVSSRATATIENDDSATLVLAGVNASQLEGTGALPTVFRFSVTLDNAVQGGFRVAFTTNDGPLTPDPNIGIATSLDDYVDNDGNLTFIGNASERLFIDVLVNADAKVEATELFNVVLGMITGLGAGIDPGSVKLSDSLNDRQQVGTILNRRPDDVIGEDTTLITFENLGAIDPSGRAAGFSGFEIPPALANTTGRMIAFRVRSSNAVQRGFKVAFGTRDSSATVADGDYVSKMGELTFAGLAGEEQMFFVEINPNRPDEPQIELFSVTLGTITPLEPGVNTGDLLLQSSSINVEIRNDGQIQQYFVTAAGPGGGPHVRVFNSTDFSERLSFFAYDARIYTGGVRVAVGDVNGDGTPDIITGTGPGGGPHVKVFDGTNGAELYSFFAFGPTFFGGSYMGAADFTGDGRAEIIVGADAGGNSHVKVFNVNQSTTTPLFSFYAYGPGFFGGVRVAAGDVNGDGTPDIITGAGVGGRPHIRVFDGSVPQETTTPLDLGGPTGSFYAFVDTEFFGGVFVASGDFNGDNRSDIVVGAGPGGGPLVRVISGADGSELKAGYAYQSTFTGGVYVAVTLTAGDNRPDLVVGPGRGGTPRVSVQDLIAGTEIRSFEPFGSTFAGGVFVGGSLPQPIAPSPSNSSLALRVDAEESPSGPAEALQQSAIQALIDEATNQFDQAGLATSQSLSEVDVEIVDLEGDRLGEVMGGTIRLDRDAAGYGWFIDPTPVDDDEFQSGNPEVLGRVDLLTVLTHELGHILGLTHHNVEPNFMSERLTLGTRHRIEVEEVVALDSIFANHALPDLME